MNLLGTHIDANDPQMYVVAWALLTLLLVIIASRAGSFAITTALVVAFGIFIATYGQTPINTVTVNKSTSGAGGGGRRS